MKTLFFLCLLFLGGEFLSIEAGAKNSIESSQNCTTSKCHNDIKNHEVLHRPLKADGCRVCHRDSGELVTFKDPHPRLARLTPKESNSACLLCHEDVAEQQSHAAFKHKVIDDKGCVSCHDPHGAKNQKLLKEKSPELCLNCHDKMSHQMSQDSHKHKALSEKAGCLNCHVAHTASNKKLLKVEGASLCLECHKKDLKLQGMRAHTPVHEGRCVACHNPHSEKNEKLLVEKFPSTAEPYQRGAYGLCFKCHKVSLADSKITETETGFRNGSQNLHHLHLIENKTGRSCRTCHEIHASQQEQLIRDDFELRGVWLPIKFKKTSDGGSCATACHKFKSYNRVEAVKNELGK